ncbi:AraC family transcriptional regulator [Mediterraneibacter gnavus]|uniref:AraC family transcriptional regulator n=1 Tax=Mediterraneibacter gnavus TaxID=33038 RepID=A0A415S5M1_MEDGN|nr:AraC family transcriptional regulator [Mediterraneibacter gnavus]
MPVSLTSDNFSKCFRKQFGISPSEYRKNQIFDAFFC